MKSNTLAHNTLMLYILKGSIYIFGIITIPYLSRVLGVEVYGKIGFATAFATYIQLIGDFGFILSGTASVANAAGDNVLISKELTSVTTAKALLLICCGLLLSFLYCFIPQFHDDPLLFFLYYLYTAVNVLLPDFVYRGIERMTTITVCSVLLRGIFLLGVFAFIKDETQYIMVPFFYLLGALVSCVVMYCHLAIKLSISFCKIKFMDVIDSIRYSSLFFISRIASTFYSSLNTMVLGFTSPNSLALGHFTACNSAVNAGKNLTAPIADSIFPYMLRTKNFKLLIQIIIIGELIYIPICVVIGIYAPQLCEWFFGNGYYESGYLMRILIVLIPITHASYLLGFPALTPLNMSNIANNSVVIGAFGQAAMLVFLFMSNCINARNICIVTVISESIVLMIRALYFVKGLGKSLIDLRKDQ